jgi:histidyl-tRNA synthetase
MSDELIKPQTLKGFRDFLPDAMIAREQLMETARQVYRSYGFSPIDTPALEYAEILLGKGGEESDRQLFRFTDQGDRDVALRFDLTVPFARFAAQHLNELALPFKRYHIAPVWRGENTQRGRYREFLQCDFDTIGSDAVGADLETLLVINDLLSAIGFQSFTIRVNHRQLLNGLLEVLGLADRSLGVLRSLDKLGKIGPQGVAAELTEKVGATSDQTQRVLSFAELSGDPEQILNQVETAVQGSERGARGVDTLRTLVQVCRSLALPADRVALDVSIARGLDYYTGTIFETYLHDDPKIGSVCSGGRYDNLAGLFTKQPLPGVGASLGLDRLLAAMESLGRIRSARTPAQVLVVQFDAARLADYIAVGRRLRQTGVPTEVYPQARPVKKQLQYADKLGFPLAVIAGADEFARGVWQVKDLASGGQQAVADAELAAVVRAQLQR